MNETNNEKTTTRLYTDPILFNWACFELMRGEILPEWRRQWVLDTFFNDDAIRHYLETLDQRGLKRLMDAAPPDRLRGHVEALAARWPGWTDETALDGAETIAQIDPPRAVAMLRAAMAERPAEGPVEFWLAEAIAAALQHLPDDAADGLFMTGVEALDRVPSGSSTGVILDLLVAAGIRLGRAETPALARRFLAASHEQKGMTPLTVYRRLSELLFGQFDDLEYVLQIFQEQHKPMLLPLKGVAYSDDAPLEAIDDALSALSRFDPEPAEALVKEALTGPLPAWFKDRLSGPMAEPVLRLATDTKPGEAFGGEWGSRWHLTFRLACLLAAARRPAMDLSGLSADRVYDIIVINIALPPGIETAAEVLRAEPRDTVLDTLWRIAAEQIDTHGAAHALAVMAALGDPAALPRILQVADTDTHLGEEAVQDALTRFGDDAIAYFDEHFDDLDSNARMLTVLTAVQVGTPAAIDFLVRRGERLLDEASPILAPVIPTLGLSALTDALGAAAGRDDNDVDQSYAVMARLEGIKDPRLPAFTRQVERTDKIIDMMSMLRYRRIALGANAPSLTLPLTCKACGHTADYVVEQVWIAPSDGDLQPYIAQDLRCVACGQRAGFALTDEALRIVADEARELALDDPDMPEFMQEEAEACSAVKRQVLRSGDQEFSFPEAVGAAEAQVAAAPDAARPHLDLAWLLVSADRPLAGAEHLETAIGLDPTWLEAYYGLAAIMREEGKPAQALAWLDRGLPYGHALPCRRPRTARSLTEFVTAYVDQYNELAAQVDPSRPRLKPSAFKVKLGRNDLCPLGTGKKVKKCCGGTGAAPSLIVPAT